MGNALAAILGSKVTGGLDRALNNLIMKDLPFINRALTPVLRLASVVQSQVTKFFAPVGSFINNLHSQVNSRARPGDPRPDQERHHASA